MVDQKHDGDTPVIDGEFSEAKVHDAADAPRAGGSGFRRLMKALPWLIALLLACFIGGLFAAPFVERQMAAWGLMADVPAEGTGPAPNAMGAEDVADRLADLEITLSEKTTQLESLDRAMQAVAQESSALLMRLAGLEEDVAGLRSLLAQSESGVMGASTAQLDALNDGLAALRQSDRLIEGRLAALASRLTSLEAVDRGAGVGSLALAAEVLELGRRIEGGQPYQSALYGVEAALAARPAAAQAGLYAPLSELKAHADGGLPTLVELQKRFAQRVPDLVRRAVQIEAGPGNPSPADPDANTAQSGWFSWLKRSLASVIVVRPSDPGRVDAEKGGPLALISRAEAAMDAGDVAMAVAQLSALPETVQAGVVSWLEDARAFVAARAAYDRLLAALQPVDPQADFRDQPGPSAAAETPDEGL
ncbi:hypothetical protein JCM17846_00560 [Iodidimonas nitroreducens]|uniref:Uncharacterized protein n=1 Tax=Iodidimonas nitroreducens TaxID=1236968 RepID=A0A5A7N3Q6_9PROT|nr:hypothetical protein [Iodidimonas nitroreducens]GAK34886.1 hypothetical protein AQ1_02794 [alpha proteobacterium Q-1]GER02374.1 hypothetical protein JCM17846_00560 [Iodidimonas nitroreducens]